MFGSLHRPVCFLMYFFVIISAWMSVYVTSPEAVWALRPRGKPPPCPPELRERLVSLDLWTPTRLIHTTTSWRPVAFVNSQWRHFRFRLRRRAVSGESRSSSAAVYLPSDSQLHPTSVIARRLQQVVSAARRRHVDAAVASCHLVVRHCVRCRSVDRPSSASVRCDPIHRPLLHYLSTPCLQHRPYMS